MSQTDDDWDANLKDETADEFLQHKIKPPRSIEHRPAVSSKLSGNGNTTDLSRAPVYPSPRRKDSQGLKPQFEGLVRGESGMMRNLEPNYTAES